MPCSLVRRARGPGRKPHLTPHLQIALILAACVASALAITNPDMKPVIDEALIQAVKDSGAT